MNYIKNGIDSPSPSPPSNEHKSDEFKSMSPSQSVPTKTILSPSNDKTTYLQKRRTTTIYCKKSDPLKFNISSNKSNYFLYFFIFLFFFSFSIMPC